MRKPLLTFCALCASTAAAHAIGFKTQINCASDYYAYCSQYSPGSPEVRKCMRANGPKLSKACIGALIADGEVSKDEVARQKEKLTAAKAKPADAKKSDVATIKKPAPETKKASAIAAAAQPAKPEAPKPQPVKQTAVATAKQTSEPVQPKPTQPAPAATSRALTIDETTIAALKTRGDKFLEEAEPLAKSDLAITREPAAPQQDHDVAQTETAPSQDTPASTAEADDTTAVSTSEIAGVEEETAPQSPISYPPGRMSLGRNLSSQNEKASNWWDDIVRAFTGE